MEQTQDYLQTLEEEIILEPVSPGLRFANYLIDIIVYYALNFLAGILLVPVMPLIASEGGTSEFQFLFFGIALALYFLYYFLMEGITKGKTVGKMVTGTRAVSDEGLPITWKAAAIRTLVRFVPFEPFTTFGRFPWHDIWAHTITIKERK